MEGTRTLLVGVDEAGYGPNLGPLVVVAAWMEVPAQTASDSLWDCLGPTVRRHSAAESGALVVDDSKKVYAAGKGLHPLEETALAWLGACGTSPASLRDLWSTYCLTPVADADDLPWHSFEDLRLPTVLTPDTLSSKVQCLTAALASAGFGRPGMACQVILPRRFNELLDVSDSKAAALFQVNARLLRHIWDTAGCGKIEVTLDKHGGRNFYRVLLQQAFPETLVLAGREGAEASQYTFSGDGRRLQATFSPKADARHLLVALASMIAKYLRELSMSLFNGFWTHRIPGIRPTAGYPLDAKRFWNEIEAETVEMGVPKEHLWRNR